MFGKFLSRVNGIGKFRLVTILLVFIISFLFYGCTNLTQSKSETDKFIEQQEIKGKEIEKQFNEAMQEMNKELELQQKRNLNLEIQDGWTSEINGDYLYIRGRIKNIGKTPITYWKLTAEFLDNNDNVLDTDYTNSLETIQAGNMKEFEIMHKYQKDYSKTRIFIEEVR